MLSKMLMAYPRETILGEIIAVTVKSADVLYTFSYTVK